MPAPRTPKEVKQFLGFGRILSKIHPQVCRHSQALNALTRKAVDFVWDEICERSFQLLSR